MFNDRYGLTKAVIESRKTMTRRLADPKSKYEELRLWQPCIEMEFGLYGYTENDGWEYIEPYYFVGEVVAVAQSYRDVCASGFEPNAAILRLFEDQRLASWSNKMFVKAELMPHQIRITGIKCERCMIFRRLIALGREFGICPKLAIFTLKICAEKRASILTITAKPSLR